MNLSLKRNLGGCLGLSELVDSMDRFGYWELRSWNWRWRNCGWLSHGVTRSDEIIRRGAEFAEDWNGIKGFAWDDSYERSDGTLT